MRDEEGRGFRLDVANRFWGAEGFHFRPEYFDLTRLGYGAELARVDFHKAELARREINAWVEKQTQGKIRDLIQPGAVGVSTRLVLTNAIYFKGDWTSPFDKAATRDEDFQLGAGTKASVPMMRRKSSYSYFEGDGLKALEIPYGRGDLAMDVLLPDRVVGRPDLEARLTADSLAKWLGGLRSREVEVMLPRFTMTSRFELGQVLGAMGMTRAFDPDRADFSGMSTEDQLSISAVIHQAFVDVKEEGTEAAAARAVAIRALAVMKRPTPAVFRADRPFLFLIRDVRSGSILFLGRVANPKG